jgi:hypothetical protein
MELILVVLAAVLILAVMLGVIFGYALLDGFVLTKLWLWFMVPVFGLPELGLAQAIGISLVVSWLTYRPNEKQDDDQEKTTKQKVSMVLKPLARAGATLLIGYIVKQVTG